MCMILSKAVKVFHFQFSGVSHEGLTSMEEDLIRPSARDTQIRRHTSYSIL